MNDELADIEELAERLGKRHVESVLTTDAQRIQRIMRHYDNECERMWRNIETHYPLDKIPFFPAETGHD